jgi:hypothetical protein
LTGEKDQPGFASRWSRLKQDAKVEAEELTPEEPDLPAEDDRPDAEVLEELGLPDPDTLKPGDDFAGFMAKAVPARLRTRALRKLWVSNPVLANLDELVDYGEDFTDAATVIEDLQTAYQAGKGYVQKAAELVDDGDGAAEPGEDSPVPDPVPDAEAEPDEDSDAVLAAAGEPEQIEPPEDAPGVEEAAAVEATKTPAPAPGTHARQRMRFRVVEE